MSPEVPTLLDSWDTLVRADPAARAVVESGSGRSFSRREVSDRAAAWIAAQSELTDLAGRPVVFAQPNGVEWFAIFIGLLRAGAIPAPIDGSEPPQVQRHIASSIGAAAVWLDGQLLRLATARTRRPRQGIALIKLTSGSTGAPRALAFTDAEIAADGHQVCATMGIRPDDTNFALIPLGHSYGLGNLVAPLLVQGTPLVCASSPLPHAVAADLARSQATIFPLVPAVIRALNATNVAPESLRSLRVVISAGAPLDPAVAQAFRDKFDRLVHGFYGSSETGGIAYDRDGTATLAGRGVGTPLAGVTVRVRPGRRIVVSSRAVFTRGNRMRAEGWGAFSPADRAVLNDQGELALLGRVGRMVKISGRRLDLAELEQTFRKLPGIREAYLTSHPAAVDELAAAVATDLSLAEVRALLRAEVAAWKSPRRLLILKDFPLTARGKTDTRALQGLLHK
jgi:long-chain acyl-CoA synthetase